MDSNNPQHHIRDNHLNKGLRPQKGRELPFLPLIYLIGIYMVKRFKFIPLACLLIVNIVLAVSNGFMPLSIVVIILSAIALAWELIDTCRGGGHE